MLESYLNRYYVACTLLTLDHNVTLLTYLLTYNVTYLLTTSATSAYLSLLSCCCGAQDSAEVETVSQAGLTAPASTCLGCTSHITHIELSAVVPCTSIHPLQCVLCPDDSNKENVPATRRRRLPFGKDGK